MPLAEPPVITFNPEVTRLRAGVVAPDPVPISFGGKAYTLRFIPDGGMGYTQRPTDQVDARGVTIFEQGLWYLDTARVGGAASKMEAVAVYLHFCHGLDTVEPIWGDEIVPKDSDTGEYAFEYPDACPKWDGKPT